MANIDVPRGTAPSRWRRLIRSRGDHKDAASEPRNSGPDHYRDRATSTTGLCYIYRPLKEPGEIRLLDIANQHDLRAPIQLTTRHIIIQDPPEVLSWTEATSSSEIHESTYYALSYTWGTEKADRLIIVDGIDFQVTTNLESALQHLRAHGVSSLWVDCICINQRDNVEKSMQVRLMNRIFASAFAVFIYLGEEKSTTALAMDFLDKRITMTYRQGEIHITNDLPSTRNKPEHVAAWDAVGQDLMKRPWWRRMWVIQEIAVARRAIVLCGQRMLQWNKLCIGSQFAQDYDLRIFHDSEDGFHNGWNLRRKQTYRIRRAISQAMPLQELLVNNISCSATDPRDMIFSLLGLATDTDGAADLYPNYNEPVERLYTNFVKFQVRQHGSLDIISMSKHPKQISGLPSWVPDWSNVKNTTPFYLAPLIPEEFDESAYVYRASGCIAPDVSFLNENTVIRVAAIFVDTISSMGETCSAIESLPSDLAAWSLLAHGTGSNYVCGGSTAEAYNRTITCDKARSGSRAQRGQRGFEPFMLDETDIPQTYRGQQSLTPEERQRFFVEDAMQAVALRAHRRRFLITKDKYFGLGPPDTETGDALFILLGCSVPVVLRKTGEQWHFVGESFVCGIMDGEIVRDIYELEGHTNMDNIEKTKLNHKDSSRYKVEDIQIS